MGLVAARLSHVLAQEARSYRAMRSESVVTCQHTAGGSANDERANERHIQQMRHSMIEQTIHIDRPDGQMETFIVHPDDGPCPVVIIYHDGPGLRDDFYDMARRLAAAGYYVVLPDLYFRFGAPRMNMSRFGDPQLMAEMMNRVEKLLQNDRVVLADTEALVLEACRDSAADTAAPFGCLGFCIGARFMLRTMAAAPTRFAAGAGWH